MMSKDTIEVVLSGSEMLLTMFGNTLLLFLLLLGDLIDIFLGIQLRRQQTSRMVSKNVKGPYRQISKPLRVKEGLFRRLSKTQSE
jgi:hypothetical protein